MQLRQRIERLEAQGQGQDDVNTIVRTIYWADGTRIGYMGRVLTESGWQTLSRGGDTSETEFERELIAIRRSRAFNGSM